LHFDLIYGQRRGTEDTGGNVSFRTALQLIAGFPNRADGIFRLFRFNTFITNINSQ